MKIAADSSHRSIFQSALVFFAATFGVYLICDIDIVRSICMMLARGAFISALVIMLFLTPVLVVCEGFINKTSFRWRVKKNPTKIDIEDDEPDEDDNEENEKEESQAPDEKKEPVIPAKKPKPPVEVKEITSPSLPVVAIPAKSQGRPIQHGTKKIAKVPKSNTTESVKTELFPSLNDEETSKLIDEIITSASKGDDNE